MNNLEGIKISEIDESVLEKESIKVTDELANVDYSDLMNELSKSQEKKLDENDLNFDDCVLTESEKEQKTKEEVSESFSDDYENCRIRRK